jgi:hypothetical protein
MLRLWIPGSLYYESPPTNSQTAYSLACQWMFAHCVTISTSLLGKCKFFELLRNFFFIRALSITYGSTVPYRFDPRIAGSLLLRRNVHRFGNVCFVIPFGCEVSTTFFAHRIRYLKDRITVSRSTSNTTSRRANCSKSLHCTGKLQKADLDLGGPHISPLNPRNPPS